MLRLILLIFWIIQSIILFGQRFSLQSALSAPYCSSLVSSPDGDAIVWVVNDAGVRTIYTARSPEFQAERRYSTNADDGQVISNIQFDHQSRTLYFVKGSASNRAGEIANPASLVIYPRRLLFRLDLSGGELDTIGAFSNYLVSADGSFLLVWQGSSLQKVNLADKKLELLIQMRGSFSDVSYQPAGEKILFVSNRDDHSFIGLYQLGEPAIKWVAPSLHRDQNPVWSADGKKIAFIRAPGQRNGQLADITGGNPFSIMQYNLASSRTEELWSSPADDGGFAQYYHEEPLRWTKNDQILFYSEHEGYMKIYHLNPGSGVAKSIIAGDCEVEHSHLKVGNDELVFSSNCGDLDRRNLFIYNIASGELEALTAGEKIETDPRVLSTNLYAFRESGTNFPTRICLLKDGVVEIVFPKNLPEDYPAVEFVVPKQVIFTAADGTEIHGQLFVKEEEGSKPGLLFLHGGPIRQMLLGYHYSDYYANAYIQNQYLANLGYVVLSVNYRSGIGYGKAFRRAENQGPRGASEYQDIVAGAEYLQNLAYVDKEKIGLWGGSYGGLLTAQGLARNSDIFKAGVDFHGVHDWSWRATDFSKGGFWGITDELMENAFTSSPASEVATWKSPVLLIHGDDDRNVMFGQSIDLARRLEEQGVHFEILVLPDEVHGFYRYDSWLRSYQASAEFFDRLLKR